MCFTGRNVTVNGPILVCSPYGAPLNRTRIAATSCSRHTRQAESADASGDIFTMCSSSSARVPVKDRRLCAAIFDPHSQSARQCTLRLRPPFDFADQCHLRRTDSS